MKNLGKCIVSRILAPTGVVFLFGFGCNTIMSYMPHHAYVFVDNEKEYIAPPYLMKEGYDNIEHLELYAHAFHLDLKRYNEVRKTGKLNSACRDEGYYVQEGRSPSGMLLEYAGILPPLEPRWNKDGTWNY